VVPGNNLHPGGDGLLTMLTAAMDGPHGALVQGG
jgi:hypothetical protein